MQRLLLDKAMCAFDELRQETANYRGMMVAVGLPVEENGSIYNCAALILNGEVIGVVAKTYRPNYGEFYENAGLHQPRKRLLTAMLSAAGFN